MHRRTQAHWDPVMDSYTVRGYDEHGAPEQIHPPPYENSAELMQVPQTTTLMPALFAQMFALILAIQAESARCVVDLAEQLLLQEEKERLYAANERIQRSLMLTKRHVSRAANEWHDVLQYTLLPAFSQTGVLQYTLLPACTQHDASIDDVQW